MHINQYRKLGFSTYEDLESFLDRADVKVMIGKNYDHYRELWLANLEATIYDIKKKKIKGAFNWLALLGFLIWAAYRKLYGMFGIIFLILTALSFLEVYYSFDGSKGLAGGWIVLAFISKDIYLQQLVAYTKKLDDMHDEHKREQFLNSHNGVSKLYAWLAFPVFVVINILAAEFASKLSGNPF